VHADLQLTVIASYKQHRHGMAANLTILDVLTVTGAGINQQSNRLATIGTRVL
tara:strand:- start:371 stop:529 length:159 start_codon:yes stop_codon:yes gene_type:complete